MGLFSKTPKLNPKIIVEGIEISFQHEPTSWTFKYREVDFISYDLSLVMPAKSALDTILADLESLKPEIHSRLQKGLDAHGAKLGEGEEFLVDVQEFAADRTFTVSWFGGESWGDMGADFTIKNREIVDEAWGD
jgi:hypothetical protein